MKLKYMEKNYSLGQRQHHEDTQCAKVIVTLGHQFTTQFRKHKEGISSRPSLPQFTFREDVVFSSFSYNRRIRKLSSILSTCQKFL